jgi:FixJ family two-component response regulator
MPDNLASRGEMFALNREPAGRENLCVVLAAGAYRVLCFPDGAALMAMARSRAPNCIPLEMHFPRRPGPDVRKEHHGDDHPGSLFMISGQGDIAMAVRAIKNGALDFIESRSGAAKSLAGWIRRSGRTPGGTPTIRPRKPRRCILPAANS